jgi:DNA-binding transcriptional LysR family regulator
MELRHLRYFVAVAEELNFRRAAERLGINQPPLSVQILQLEKEMGTTLFRRLTRGVELTDAGKLFLEEARLILKQVEVAKTGVRRRGRGETGKIIIGSAGGTYFHPLIPAILREFGKSYPDMMLAPQAGATALLTAQLRGGQIDVAFVRPPLSDAERIATHHLIVEDTVIVLPAKHRLAKKAAVPLSALAHERFVMFPRDLNPEIYDAVMAACRHAGFEPMLGQEAPQVLNIPPLVAAGFGVSIVPRSISRVFRDGVAYVSIVGKGPRAEIRLAHRQNERSAAVHNFVSVAQQVTKKWHTTNKTDER